MPRIHIIGAGMAGLASAVEAIGQGFEVSVYESAGHAGGRCRSFFDEKIGRHIDNGNHLMLSGNWAVERFCRQIGSDGLHRAKRAAFPFVDIETGKRWRIDMGAGRFPWWLFSKRRRIPGTQLGHYSEIGNVLKADPASALGDILDKSSPLYSGFWEPFVVSIMNTPVDQVAVGPLQQVLRETMLKGGQAARPLVALNGLSPLFATPALDYIGESGGEVRLNCRITELVRSADRVSGLVAGGEKLELPEGDCVILAVPSWIAGNLVDDISIPLGTSPIVNAHYAVDGLDGEPRVIGVLNGSAQWIFTRSGLASVTVSAANSLINEPGEEIAKILWRDVAMVLELDAGKLPSNRIVKEKRATFLQTAEACAKRPGPCHRSLQNLFISGDWTATGLPATIEGAIRSGYRAVVEAKKTLGG